jgi:hypothetical protein
LEIAVLGFTGLTLHEVSNWRKTHHLPNLRWPKEADQLNTSPLSRAAQCKHDHPRPPLLAPRFLEPVPRSSALASATG